MSILASIGSAGTDSDRLEALVARHYVAIAGAILVAAVGLRIYNLGGTSLWVDEAVFANNSLVPFGEMIRRTRFNNSGPIFLPLVYYLLGDAMRDPALVRALPMAFGVLSVAVVLALPRVGVPALVAALAALLLTVNPQSVEYSQEVREYSLSGLATCVLIYVCLLNARKPSKASLAAVSVVMVSVPFAAYGSIFAALSLLGASTLFAVLDRRRLAIGMLLPWGLLGCALALSWVTTAKYQMRVVSAWYLADYYPPEGLMPAAGWAVSSLADYMSYAAGSVWLAPIVAVLLAGLVASMVLGRPVSRGPTLLIASLALLVMGSLAAAVLGLYPFGGIRNHQFAVPLVALCTAWAAVSIAAMMRQIWPTMFLTTLACVFVAASAARLPDAYEEQQDIVSAVNIGLRDVSDQTVYVYAPASLALAYHFPDKRYMQGSYKPGDSQFVAREAAESIHGCRVHLLLSHFKRGFDDEIVDRLSQYGFALVNDQRFVGTRVASLSRCPGATP